MHDEYESMSAIHTLMPDFASKPHGLEDLQDQARHALLLVPFPRDDQRDAGPTRSSRG